MFAYHRKIIRNPLFLITTIGLLFYAGLLMNNATYGQQVVDNTNRTASLDPAPENEAIVVIPAPSAEDFTPQAEQQAGTKEKVLDDSEKRSDNEARSKVQQPEIQKDKVSESDQTSDDRQAPVSENEVQQPEIQKDKVSESDQTSDDRQAPVSENEEKEDNSGTREEENENDDEDDDADVPFVLPFP